MIRTHVRLCISLSFLCSGLSCCPEMPRSTVKGIEERMEASEPLTDDQQQTLSRLARSRCSRGDLFSICYNSPGGYHPLLVDLALRPETSFRNRNGILKETVDSIRDRDTLWKIYRSESYWRLWAL